MTIAFDAKRYFNNTTGLGFYSRTLVEGLRRLYPEQHYLLYTPYNRGGLAPTDDGIRLPDSWLGRAFHPIWRGRGLTAQLRRDKVDVFHGLSHELPIGLGRAGIRSVVTMHDLIFLRHPELYPPLDRFFYLRKYRRSAREADIVVAISAQTQADLQTFFKVPASKLRVIGQSCHVDFERLSLRHLPDRMAIALPEGLNLPESDYLISVGSLIPRKNWHLLLDAMYLLQKQGIELPLVAVGTGKGAYPERLLAQAKRLGIRVHWVGYLSTQQLALLYRRAACLVYPSVFEGFGIPILEAMTVGIPVVTTRGGCFEEVGGPAALYADPTDAESLAAQIARTLDSGTRATLVAKMPVQIAQFSPETVCAAWMAVYRELLKST